MKFKYLYIVNLRHVILHSACGRGHIRALLVISHIPYIDETLGISTYQILVVPCKAHWWYLLPKLILIIMYYLLMRVCLFLLMLLLLLTSLKGKGVDILILTSQVHQTLNVINCHWQNRRLSLNTFNHISAYNVINFHCFIQRTAKCSGRVSLTKLNWSHFKIVLSKFMYQSILFTSSVHIIHETLQLSYFNITLQWAKSSLYYPYLLLSPCLAKMKYQCQ